MPITDRIVVGFEFLSTLSLRRATALTCSAGCVCLFLSTLSLRRATGSGLARLAPRLDFYPRSPCGERPYDTPSTSIPKPDFYPRSPCGERPGKVRVVDPGLVFLSTLSLRRATSERYERSKSKIHFYPRSPCGERHTHHFPALHDILISIHALLAESDTTHTLTAYIALHFYPRSPCGERHFSGSSWVQEFPFLSTLSLRRATHPQHED